MCSLADLAPASSGAWLGAASCLDFMLVCVGGAEHAVLHLLYAR